MQESQKKIRRNGLLDVAIILAVLRASSIPDSRSRLFDSAEVSGVDQNGPLLGVLHSIPSPDPWRDMSSYSFKSYNHHYDIIMDEYESIMSDLYSRPPAMYLPHVNGANGTHPAPPVRNEITMVIGIRNPNVGGGEVQVASNHFAGGAVGGGGFSTGWFDDNFDIFNNFLPSSMGEDEINNLILSSNHENATNTNAQSDTRWQQFLTGYESLDPFQAKRMDSLNWGGQDVLSEAILSSELFSNPVLNAPESSSAMDIEPTQEENLLSETRLELIDNQEWSTQNHEEDLLFPSLPPPSYEEAVNSSSTNNEPPVPLPTHHMHDHNYFNRTGPTNVATTTVTHAEQPIAYAIRSRHEVSTRVITIPPRTHAPPTASVPEVFETISNSSSETSVPELRESVRRITTGSDSGIEGDLENQSEDISSLLPSASSQYDLNDLHILPLNSTYYQNLSRVVGHSEVIVCN